MCSRFQVLTTDQAEIHLIGRTREVIASLKAATDETRANEPWWPRPLRWLTTVTGQAHLDLMKERAQDVQALCGQCEARMTELEGGKTDRDISQ